MLLYFNFTATPSGYVANQTAKKYCPQGGNATLYDCSQTNPSYMPLSRFAEQSFRYAKSNDLFLSELIPAFKRLNNVTSEFTDPTYLRGFYTQIVCVNGQEICSGDIWFMGCGRPLTAC